MSKEQEILKNAYLKSWSYNGSDYIKRRQLLNAIIDADYTEEQAYKIIERMQAKGYIRCCGAKYNMHPTYVILKLKWEE